MLASAAHVLKTFVRVTLDKMGRGTYPLQVLETCDFPSLESPPQLEKPRFGWVLSTTDD